MRKKSVLFRILLLAILLLGAGALLVSRISWGFAREVSPEESALRLQLVEAAQGWLGWAEEDGTHRQIIDLYNSHTPLAQGYRVQYTDDWCATFVSAVAIQCGFTEYIPTECGCERQIVLWQDLGRWEEQDSYLPLPGDIIYYDWEVRTLGDSTGWADHVGIVVGTHGPFIKVIEGNKDDSVGYRFVLRWDPRIRGYGLPNY